jgi:hypothetical protein
MRRVADCLPYLLLSVPAGRLTMDCRIGLLHAFLVCNIAAMQQLVPSWMQHRIDSDAWSNKRHRLIGTLYRRGANDFANGCRKFLCIELGHITVGADALDMLFVGRTGQR